MRRIVLVALMSGLACADAFAQSDVGVSAVGLLSWQPVDRGYVGSPYLSEGIGGIGPGFGVGLDLTTRRGFVVAAEFSTARFEQEQYGRLVGGAFPNDGVPHTTRLRDSLLMGLAGVSTTSGSTRVRALGGVGTTLDSPTIDGEPRDAPKREVDDRLPFVLAAGVDVLHSFNTRAAFVFGMRYAYSDRPENHRYLGIGSHLVRIGAGVRIRIGS
jgi:hypothetical protein